MPDEKPGRSLGVMNRHGVSRDGLTTASTTQLSAGPPLLRRAPGLMPSVEASRGYRLLVE